MMTMFSQIVRMALGAIADVPGSEKPTVATLRSPTNADRDIIAASSIFARMNGPAARTTPTQG
jgi:hypothetical protein